MILDAGCGNRIMWEQKNNPDIIFIDIEKELQRKPNIFASNIALPFTNEMFDSVFFDPPFKWNCDDHQFFSFPNREKLHKMYPDIRPDTCPPSYYGIDRYKTRSELVNYIYRAEKELYRILKPDGMLWVRWCEMVNMTHHQVLAIFQNWRICLTHEIGSSKRVTGETNSYWFMLMKNLINYQQPELLKVASNGVQSSSK
jgi:hypothetical protein